MSRDTPTFTAPSPARRLLVVAATLGCLLALTSTSVRADDGHGQGDDQAHGADDHTHAVPEIKHTVIATGEGPRCEAGKAALVHYVGTLKDGTEFDSSRKRGDPLPVVVGAGSVIKGWDQTLAKMRVGDRWRVEIPWQLAYGERGAGGKIGPRTDLVFDMEVMDVVAPEVTYEKRGEGDVVPNGKVVEAHITLSLPDGTAWKDTRLEKAPAMMTVGRPTGLVGLDMVLRSPRVGDKLKATVPAALAFGKKGNPPKIGPDQDQIVEVEILQVLEPKIEILKQGTGPLPKTRQRVTVHYVGTLLDGTKFDSSRDKMKPFRFIVGIGQVIPGWDMAVKQLSVGTRAKVTVPHQLAYGNRAAGKIPPKSTLVFDIEVLALE